MPTERLRGGSTPTQEAVPMTQAGEGKTEVLDNTDCRARQTRRGGKYADGRYNNGQEKANKMAVLGVEQDGCRS